MNILKLDKGYRGLILSLLILEPMLIWSLKREDAIKRVYHGARIRNQWQVQYHSKQYKDTCKEIGYLINLGYYPFRGMK